MPLQTNKPSPSHPAGLRGWFGPSWRAQIARQEASPVLGRSLSNDPLIADMRRYLRLSQHDPGKAAGRHPVLYAADALRQRREVAEQIQIMVLAGAEANEIAQRLNLDVESVQTYERLFFDVRPLREADIWLVLHVIRPLEKQGDYLLACKFRAALSLGTPAIDAILAEDIEFPTEGIAQRLPAYLQLDALGRQALEFNPSTDEGWSKVLFILTRHYLGSKRLELEEKKHTEKCAQAARLHEIERDRQAVRKAYFEERAAKKKLAAAEVELKLERLRAGSAPSTFGLLKGAPGPKAAPPQHAPPPAARTAGRRATG